MKANHATKLRTETPVDSPNQQIELATNLRIDEICDEFEAEWQASVRPDFDQYLRKFKNNRLDRLLHQLLSVDVELRIDNGQSVTSDDYRAVHPDAPSIIEALLESLSEQVDIDTVVDISDQVAMKMIGPFRLQEQIGQGGMGVVWKAVQNEPIQRTVAIKVVKQGLYSKQLLARFEAERQAQALMEHPNIVRIIDAGTTQLGRPYFAMEFVEGEPLVKYCVKKQMPVRERLALFDDVCSAIQHAHQKQIIHRDIKPNNIIVCESDEGPLPKVIDFGLSKALQAASDNKIETQFGQLLGSLQYMSPEQASSQESQIDTRTDIYSLGVSLLELLTGETPISKQQIMNLSVPEILNKICDERFIRPSQVFLSSESRVAFALSCGTTPDRLQRQLAGELDWIVAKSLSHNRDLRYQSVSELREDIRRYLNNEIVLANPPSNKYRLKRFLRKHRKEAIAVGLLLATLTAGIVGTTSGWLSARNRAEGERKARQKSQLRLAQAENSNRILGTIFKDLRISTVKQSSAELRETLARRLKRAAKDLDQESIGDPLAFAEMQRRLGESLVSLGFARDGIPLVEASLNTKIDELGMDDLDVLKTASDLGYAYNHNNQPGLAAEIFQDVVPRLAALLGSDHKDVLTAQKRLAFSYTGLKQFDSALHTFTQTMDLETARYGKDTQIPTMTLISVAGSNLSLGKIDLAKQQFQKAIQLFETEGWESNPEKMFRALNGLAGAMRLSNDFENARATCQKSFDHCIEQYGRNHPRTLLVVDQLAGIHLSLKQYERVIPLMKHSLAAFESRLPPSAVDCIRTRRKLGFAYLSLDDLENALNQYKAIATLASKESVRDEAERYVLSLTRGLAEKAKIGAKEIGADKAAKSKVTERK